MEELEIINYLKNIESQSFGYKDLLTYDYLFEIKGNTLDDNDLIGYISILDSNNYMTWCKLRGDYDDPFPKLADSQNDHDYCHGYVVFVGKESVASFEKQLLPFMLKDLVHVMKVPIINIHNAIKRRNEELFDSLFEYV